MKIKKVTVLTVEINKKKGKFLNFSDKIKTMDRAEDQFFERHRRTRTALNRPSRNGRPSLLDR